jgi:hypothetical protein
MALILLSSCSTEKRLYNRGFHIEWRELHGRSHNGEHLKTLQARRAAKTQVQRNNTEAKAAIIESIDSLLTQSSQKTFNKKQSITPVLSVLPKLRSSNFKDQKMAAHLSIGQLKKSDTINYYGEPSGDVSSGLAGFLTSLVALLMLFGMNTLLWGMLLLLVALVLCIMGIVEQLDEPDTTDLIFAVLGLCICGFTIFYFQPVIWSTVLFFIANPGIFLCLLLILGIYLLMNA